MKRKKKVLILTSTFPRWNNDKTPPFILHLARHLQRYFKVFVIAPHFPGAKTKEKLGEIEIYRFRYFLDPLEKLCYEGGGFSKVRKNLWLNFLLPFYFIAAFVSTLILVRKKKIELINAHWVLPQGLIAVLMKKLTKTPVLITIHGTDVFGLRNFFFVLLKKYALNLVDSIFTVSQRLKEEVDKLISHKSRKIKVVSMGVDINYFRRQATKNKFLIKSKYGMKRKIVVFVGRLVETKGVNYLIDAIAKVKEKFPSILLLVVGEGPLRRNLEKQAKESHLQENIHFLGWIDNRDLPGFYGAADVFVSPAFESSAGSEGLGLTFVEALASGTVVVGTKVGGIEDIIKDKQNGFLVPPGDPHKLAEAIIKILASVNLQRRLKSNSLKFIKERFDWKIIAKKYQKEIKEIISRYEFQKNNNWNSDSS